MNQFLHDMKKETNFTTTENGAGAYKSTLNACLDMFGSMGAMRHSDDAEIQSMFEKAFREDPDFAVKMAFYFRDIRGGQGTRRQFRLMMQWLAVHDEAYVINNLENFMEYGRGDDYLCLLDTPIACRVMDVMMSTLKTDYVHMKEGKPISLLAKWMPSENASSEQTKKYARQFCRYVKWTPKNYRKLLSMLRAYLKVVEVKMSAREWNSIDYETVPAKAAMIYSDAFERHDNYGYDQYLTKLAMGEADVKAASLYPVDIVHKALTAGNSTRKDRILLDAMWNKLPNYLEGKEETGICVVDVSGSMYGQPIEVAISLGMYCADKCRGPFANHFITFSSSPELVEVTGKDIFDKVQNIERANWDGSTNLEAVFALMLRTAIQNKTPKADMPQKLYIISDMQFNEARGVGRYYYSRGHYGRMDATEPFMQSMKRKYAAAGYDMPAIVYWNVRASQCGMFQSTFEGENCCMVSGYSASLFKSVIEGTTYEVEEVIVYDADMEQTKSVRTLKANIDPMTVMQTAVNNERYDAVWTRNK